MTHSLTNRAVAIMQPYFFPYIGYYQLVRAVDIFVFYDDVAYIKGGWINRNRILVNGQPTFITVPLRGASQNRLICDIPLAGDCTKLVRTIELAYRRAPFFSETMVPIKKILTSPVAHIGELAIASITAIMDHLGIGRTYRLSSKDFPHTRVLRGPDRLIAITKECGAAHYVNAIGGRGLYDKMCFQEKGLTLTFLEPLVDEYTQFRQPFQSGLSIIDALMFNGRDKVGAMLSEKSRIHLG